MVVAFTATSQHGDPPLLGSIVGRCGLTIKSTVPGVHGLDQDRGLNWLAKAYNPTSNTIANKTKRNTHTQNKNNTRDMF